MNTLRAVCWQDDMICLSCTASTAASREGHSDGERVCLAAEGFGNRTCFLQSMANKVNVVHNILLPSILCRHIGSHCSRKKRKI